LEDKLVLTLLFIKPQHVQYWHVLRTYLQHNSIMRIILMWQH